MMETTDPSSDATMGMRQRILAAGTASPSTGDTFAGSLGPSDGASMMETMEPTSAMTMGGSGMRRRLQANTAAPSEGYTMDGTTVAPSDGGSMMGTSAMTAGETAQRKLFENVADCPLSDGDGQCGKYVLPSIWFLLYVVSQKSFVSAADIYDPVECGGSKCEYSSQCLAILAGYPPEDCTKPAMETVAPSGQETMMVSDVTTSDGTTMTGETPSPSTDVTMMGSDIAARQGETMAPTVDQTMMTSAADSTDGTEMQNETIMPSTDSTEGSSVSTMVEVAMPMETDPVTMVPTDGSSVGGSEGETTAAPSDEMIGEEETNTTATTSGDMEGTDDGEATEAPKGIETPVPTEGMTIGEEVEVLTQMPSGDASMASTGDMSVPPLSTSVCTPDSPCDMCFGDCDSDDDCMGELQCFRRTGNDDRMIPGCSGNGIPGKHPCLACRLTSSSLHPWSD
jgi:hypothetical protein